MEVSLDVLCSSLGGLLQVDCDEHKSLCSKYGVSGYPTIQWFPKGSLEPKKYVYAFMVIVLPIFVIVVIFCFVIV